MQSLHEDHSVDYLNMLNEFVRSQRRLRNKIFQNEEKLLLRKREEKFNNKEL